jgi:hypothetical protein
LNRNCFAELNSSKKKKMNHSQSKSRPPFDVWLMGFVTQEPSSSADMALQRYIKEYALAVRESLEEPPQITDIRTRLSILEESGLLDPANSRDEGLKRYADSLRSSLEMYSLMSPAARAALAERAPKNSTSLTLWWFKRGPFTLFTVPIFIGLVVGTIDGYIGGVLQSIAFFRITAAAYGYWTIVISVFAIPIICLIPGTFWWGAIIAIPNELTQEKRFGGKLAAIVGILLFLPGCGSLIQYGVGKTISWVADTHPAAAIRAQVYGAKNPFDAKPSNP